MFLRRWAIRFLTPLVWKLSKKRPLGALQKFALTELDSAWQSLYAMSFIRDPQVRAMLFRHALDECRHHDVFNSLLRDYSDGPVDQPVFSRQALWQPGKKNAVLEFFSYIYAGESLVNRDFMAYSRAKIDEAIRRAFQMIQEDEKQHEENFVKTVLPLVGGSHRAVRWAVFRFRMKRAYAEYSRLMENIGQVPLAVFLGGLYFASGIFAFPVLQRRFLLKPEEQLEMIKSQSVDLQRKISAALAGATR